MKTYRQKARQTGHMVMIISAVDAGLDAGDKNNPTRWYTICEQHNEATGHPNCDIAREWASEPAGWCEACRDEVHADADICTCEIAFTGHCDACRRDPAVFA